MANKVESRKPAIKKVESYARITLATLTIGSFGLREIVSHGRDYLEYREKPEVGRLYSAAHNMRDVIGSLEDNAPQRDNSGNLSLGKDSDASSSLAALDRTREALQGVYFRELPQLTQDINDVGTAITSARNGEYHESKTKAVAVEAEAWNIMTSHKAEFDNQSEIVSMNNVIDESKKTGIGIGALFLLIEGSILGRFMRRKFKKYSELQIEEQPTEVYPAPFIAAD